jgi:hypothetical protein
MRRRKNPMRSETPPCDIGRKIPELEKGRKPMFYFCS